MEQTNAASAAFFVCRFVIRQVCQLPPVVEQVFVDTILEPTRSKVFGRGHRRKISNIKHALRGKKRRMWGYDQAMFQPILSILPCTNQGFR